MSSELYMNTKIAGLDLIVFDLDYTLWPFFADCTSPPFRKKSNGHVIDAHGAHVKSYPESPDILKKLSELGYQIGVASRTGSIKEGRDLVDLFGWNKYINYSEIYPGSKVSHFNKFKKQSGIPFEKMLFFDDESRNIVDINEIGAVAILVCDGVNSKVIEEGFREFVKQRKET